MEVRTLTSDIPVPLADKIGQQEKERHSLTLEALDDVDHRRAISHQDVKAWANSLSADTARL